MGIRGRQSRGVKAGAVLAAAGAALSLGVAGPAYAGLGDPGPGGPVRYETGPLSVSCNWLTGRITVSESITGSGLYSGWQFAGLYYKVHTSGEGWDYYDVSGDTYVGGAWIAPYGTSSASYSFTIAPPTSSQWLEIDTIDSYPSDGWYTDMSVVTPSCSRIIVHPVPVPVPTPIPIPIPQALTKVSAG